MKDDASPEVVSDHLHHFRSGAATMDRQDAITSLCACRKDLLEDSALSCAVRRVRVREVEADLTDVRRLPDQFQEQRELARPLRDELRVETRRDADETAVRGQLDALPKDGGRVRHSDCGDALRFDISEDTREVRVEIKMAVGIKEHAA